MTMLESKHGFLYPNNWSICITSFSWWSSV